MEGLSQLRFKRKPTGGPEGLGLSSCVLQAPGRANLGKVEMAEGAMIPLFHKV